MFFSDKSTNRVNSEIPKKLKKKSTFDSNISNTMLDAFQQAVINEVKGKSDIEIKNIINLRKTTFVKINGGHCRT